MADLKVPGRQVAQPTAPDLSSAASGFEGANLAVQTVARTVGEYVDSANQLEAKSHYSETLNTLNKEMVNSLSSQNIASGKAYERYIQMSEGIIEGGLKYAPKKYQKQLALDLREKVNKLGLNVAKAELTFQENKIKSEGQVILSTHLKGLGEAVEAGDYSEIQREQSSINSTLQNLQSLGAVDAVDIYKVKEGINKSVARAEYKNKFSKMLRANPVEAETFLKQFAQEKPSNLTYEEWNDIQSTLLQDRNNYLRMVDAAETLGMDEFRLAFDSGQISSTEDIQSFVESKEGQGRYFSYNDKLKMQDMLQVALRKKSSDMETVLAIDSDIANGSDNLYNYSPKELNAYYKQKSQFLLESFAKQSETNPDAPIPSPLAIRANVASSLPYPIRQFNQEYSDKLKFGTVEDFEEALKVGTQMLTNSPKSFSNLDKETQAYQQYAAKLFGNTTLPLPAIKEATDKAINQKDTQTEAKLDKELATIHRTGRIKDLYKDIYDTKFVNPALQPQFNTVSDTFDSFYKMTGDKEIASNLTKNYVRTRSGPSKYIPKNDITKDPIEETALYRQHPTLAKNEMAFGALEVVINHEDSIKEGLKLSPSIEWPDDVERPDVFNINEKQLYENLIWKNKDGKEVEPHLKVNGVNRKLLFMNANTDLEDPTADQREIWYLDEYGIGQPIYISEKHKYANGTIKNDVGIPSIEFIPAKKVTPEMAAIQEAKALEDQATAHLREEFRGSLKKVNPSPEIAPYGLPRTASILDPIDAAKRQLAIDKEEEEYIKKNLPGKISNIKESHTKSIEQLLKGNNKK